MELKLQGNDMELKFVCDNCKEEMYVEFINNSNEEEVQCCCGKKFLVKKPEYPDCIGWAYVD